MSSTLTRINRKSIRASIVVLDNHKVNHPRDLEIFFKQQFRDVSVLASKKNLYLIALGKWFSSQQLSTTNPEERKYREIEAIQFLKWMIDTNNKSLLTEQEDNLPYSAQTPAVYSAFDILEYHCRNIRQQIVEIMPYRPRGGLYYYNNTDLDDIDDADELALPLILDPNPASQNDPKLLNDYLKKNLTGSIIEKKQQYLQVLINWFDPLVTQNIQNHEKRSKEAIAFLSWIAKNPAECPLTEVRHRLFDLSHRVTTRSFIKAFRCIETFYKHQAHEIQEIKKSHPEIQKSKHYNQALTVTPLHPRERPVSLIYTEHYQSKSSSAKSYVCCKIPGDKRALIIQKWKNHQPCVLSASDLENIFKNSLKDNDKKTYADRVVTYFSAQANGIKKKNSPRQQDILNKLQIEANDFVKNALMRPDNFSRNNARYLGVKNNYTRSYCELLRFFAANYGFTPSGELNELGKCIHAEMREINRNGAGYFKQLTSTVYAPSTKQHLVLERASRRNSLRIGKIA